MTPLAQLELRSAKFLIIIEQVKIFILFSAILGICLLSCDFGDSIPDQSGMISVNLLFTGGDLNKNNTSLAIADTLTRVVFRIYRNENLYLTKEAVLQNGIFSTTTTIRTGNGYSIIAEAYVRNLDIAAFEGISDTFEVQKDQETLVTIKTKSTADSLRIFSETNSISSGDTLHIKSFAYYSFEESSIKRNVTPVSTWEVFPGFAARIENNLLISLPNRQGQEFVISTYRTISDTVSIDVR